MSQEDKVGAVESEQVLRRMKKKCLYMPRLWAAGTCRTMEVWH